MSSCSLSLLILYFASLATAQIVLDGACPTNLVADPKANLDRFVGPRYKVLDQDIQSNYLVNAIATYKRLNETVVQKITKTKTSDGVESQISFIRETADVGVFTEFVQGDDNEYNEYTCTILYLDELLYLAYLCRDLEDNKHEDSFFVLSYDNKITTQEMSFVSRFLLDNELEDCYSRTLIQLCPRIGYANCLLRIQQELGKLEDPN